MLSFLRKSVTPFDTLIPTVPDRSWQDELTRTWTVEWEDKGRKIRFTVPKGYTFEPSVPGVFKSLVPPVKIRHASAMHDWGYAHRGDVDAEVFGDEGWEPLGRPLRRRELDRAMMVVARKVEATIRERYGYEAANIPTVQLLLAWLGIRIGGSLLWAEWPERLWAHLRGIFGN